MSPPCETWIAKLIDAERAEAEARENLHKQCSRVARLIADGCRAARVGAVVAPSPRGLDVVVGRE